MSPEELDKMLDDARAVSIPQRPWPNSGKLQILHYFGPFTSIHLANCSPKNIIWMGEQIREMRESAEKWNAIERACGPDDGIRDPGDLTPEKIIAALLRTET